MDGGSVYSLLRSQHSSPHTAQHALPQMVSSLLSTTAPSDEIDPHRLVLKAFSTVGLSPFGGWMTLSRGHGRPSDTHIYIAIHNCRKITVMKEHEK